MTEPHTSPAEPAAVDRLGADMIKRLQTLNEAILWKLDGLTEYDLRRPLTPTGTNLLGVASGRIAAGALGAAGALCSGLGSEGLDVLRPP